MFKHFKCSKPTDPRICASQGSFLLPSVNDRPSALNPGDTAPRVLHRKRAPKERGVPLRGSQEEVDQDGRLQPQHAAHEPKGAAAATGYLVICTFPVAAVGPVLPLLLLLLPGAGWFRRRRRHVEESGERECDFRQGREYQKDKELLEFPGAVVAGPKR
ncbi:hypothetical protein PG993_007942 [Apiospora rasikravindrae]|uniref:Uncharacterized protein n=1 Tax=Apiospora rasikravindrae TaxID=990691 RepID=A0ABR1T0C4_9PEZI